MSKKYAAGGIYELSQLEADGDYLFGTAEVREEAQRILDEGEQHRFRIDQAERSSNRERYVYAEQVIEALQLSLPLEPLIAKARDGKVWGRAWLVKTTFRDNKFGVIPGGSLVESRGQLNETTQTFDECCKALEDEREEDAGVAGFEIQILTVNPRQKRR